MTQIDSTTSSQAEALARSIDPGSNIGTPDDQFRADATAVLGRFRQSMERLVFSVAGVLQSSRDVQYALGVDRNVSWQLFKLLAPINTLSTILHVPAAVSVRKVLAAAKKHHISEQIISEASAAFAAFERLIEETTGDRDEFQTMVMSYAESAESAQVGLQHRKSAFKAHCHYFGIAADTVAISMFFSPCSDPEKVDFLSIKHMLGLRRIRANTDILVERWKVSNSNPIDPEKPYYLGNALDPEAALIHKAVVLPEFCSQPILPMTTVVEASGDIRTILRHRDLGVGREVNITTARVSTETSMNRTTDGRCQFKGLIEISRPTQLIVVDNFVHRSTWSNLVPKSGVFAHLPTRVVPDVDRDGVQLPFQEQLTYMGSGTDALRIREAPPYPDLLKFCCQKRGWQLEDFDLYRIRIEYPLLDSNILLELEEIAPANS